MSQLPDPLADLPPEDLDVGMGAADPHPDPEDDPGIDGFDDEDEIMLDRLPAPHLDADEAVTPPRGRATGGGGGGSW